MILTINGERVELSAGTTVADYLRGHNYNVKTLVVELNEQILSAEVHEETQLQEGDVIEIVTFMGGG